METETTFNNFLCDGKNGFAELSHGSLFSGIGGFELGAEWAGIPTYWNCDINEWNRKLLKHRFPNTEQYDDIRTLTKPRKVNIISGGFPCQDISGANTKAKGIKGHRSGLWGEMYRIVGEIRPDYIIIENSPNLAFRGFERVLCDLSEIGYDAEWQCLSATTFGFRHRRERIYVIAYPNTHSKFSDRMGNTFIDVARFKDPKEWSEIRSEFRLDTKEMVFKQDQWGSDGQNTIAEPLLCGAGDGIPERMDRLAGLGNAIVPFIGYYLFECIKNHIAVRQKREEKKLLKVETELSNGTRM
jgi:DNA (cytosine-5)-methyltransferase 1